LIDLKKLIACLTLYAAENEDELLIGGNGNGTLMK